MSRVTIYEGEPTCRDLLSVKEFLEREVRLRHSLFNAITVRWLTDTKGYEASYIVCEVSGSVLDRTTGEPIKISTTTRTFWSPSLSVDEWLSKGTDLLRRAVLSLVEHELDEQLVDSLGTQHSDPHDHGI